VTPGRSIAILGGLDTKGTEGATMFATSKFSQLVQTVPGSVASGFGSAPEAAAGAGSSGFSTFLLGVYKPIPAAPANT
jgi:hypothetical protein